jgi:hypothetical protein
VILPGDMALVIPWWAYAGFAFVFSALIRLPLAFFRCYRVVAEQGGGVRAFVHAYWCTFIGLGCKSERESVRGDYLTSFVLGGIELMVFPVLFAAGLDMYIGAWLGVKVAAQHKHWSNDRVAFAAFLVGNALVLIVAFVYLQGYVGSLGNV